MPRAEQRKRQRTMRLLEEQNTTLKSECGQMRKDVGVAKAGIITLARENARLTALLKHYMEADNSLLSSSQIDQSQSTSQVLSPPAQITATEVSSAAVQSNSIQVPLSLGELFKDGTVQVPANDSIPIGNLSQFSQNGTEDQLTDLIDFLDRHDKLELDRLGQLQEEMDSMKNTKIVRVGVATIVKSAHHPGCVLIGRRIGSHGAGTIQLPGGHLEFGESWSMCAERELQEETGLVVRDFKFAAISNDVFDLEGKHYITIFMSGEVTDDTKPVVMEPEKCEGWGWRTWASLQAYKDSDSLFLPLQNLIDQGYVP